MTDLQLAILLRQYRERLAQALRQIESELPETMKETHKNLVFPGNPIITYPVLDKLWDIVNEVDRAVSNLERSPT